jgi:hypothetical protein
VSQPFAFIATKTTADIVVPRVTSTPAEFQHRVSGAFGAMNGGLLRVGDIKFRPNEDPIPNHLLCDGSTISRLQFPELVQFLAGDATEADLPDYSGALTVAPATEEQTTTPSGTVETPAQAPADQGDVGGTDGGNVPSGGRVYDPNQPYPIWYIPPELGP